MATGCAWPQWTGKPLQIAVDGVPGTMEATNVRTDRAHILLAQHVRGGAGALNSRVSFGVMSGIKAGPAAKGKLPITGVRSSLGPQHNPALASGSQVETGSRFFP